MKILIVGMLGSGKSSLAYDIQKKYKISRLNLDEISRNKDGSFRKKSDQVLDVKKFIKQKTVL